jgi:small nuclear ribonucleoprotein (snRNP)-like protein
VWSDAWLALRGQRVLVNLKSGTALRGVVWAVIRGHVQLRDCEVVSAGQRSDPASDVRFAKGEVDFYQVFPDAGMVV